MAIIYKYSLVLSKNNGHFVNYSVDLDRIQWKTFTKSFFNPSLIDIEKYRSFDDFN